MKYLFLSILFFSFNNVLWKRNIIDTNISFLVSYRALFTSLLSFIIALYFNCFDALSFVVFCRITLGSIFGVLGLLCMLNVIKKESLHWLGVYNLVGIIFTTCYLIVFEKVDFNKSILGAILIIIGFAYHIFKNRNESLNMSLKQHLLLLFMAVFYCCSSILHWKNLEREIAPVAIVFNQEFVVFLTALGITFFQNKKEMVIRNYKLHFHRVLLMAAVIFFALLFSFLGLKETNPLVSSIVFLASPLITILLNLVFFKEKLTNQNIIALIILFFGAFLLHYFSR